jgi:hypothetical protein
MIRARDKLAILLDGIISEGESQSACRPLPYLSLAPGEQDHSTPKLFSFYHLLLDTDVPAKSFVLVMPWITTGYRIPLSKQTYYSRIARAKIHCLCDRI